MARGVSSTGAPPLPFDLTSLHEIFTGIQVPDPITFICGEDWLDRGNLYPRQATLIKVVFLREDLFTEYDYDVVEEWEEQYRASNGTEGLAPGVIFKMRLLRAHGHKWFREVLLVMGRRAGKGHVTALCMLYVLWNYMAKGDPQKYYGVDKSKKLVTLVFAGKRDQAKATVFGDIQGIVTDAPCFQPFINDNHTEKLSIYAPHDFVKIRRQAERGIKVDRDQATFVIQPRESTVMAGRGPTSMMQCLDPATLVLKSDLTWVAIGDLEPGDRVVGVDEEPQQGRRRRMRDAEVQAVWRTRKSALRLTFADGSSVTCSADHRWLVQEMGASGSTKWRQAGNLKVGNRIKHVVDPWEYDESREAGYLAGVYDGEGCVSGWEHRTGKSVFFTQNAGPVLDYTLSLLKERGFTPIKTTGRQGAEQWSLGGFAESMAFLGSIRPSRLMEKAHGVWEGTTVRGGRTPNNRQRPDACKTITSIEMLPEQELVDITTSTGTFLAEGLISHNCYDEMAHVVASGANRSAEEVYGAAKPSLDQFGKDAFICEPSSPWQMNGQFYENWQHANEKDEDGDFVYPDMLSLQLASWDIYLDWERTNPSLVPAVLRLLPEGFKGDLGEYDPDNEDHIPQPQFQPLRGAIQIFDSQMALEERANPDTFKVERRAKWAASLQAYLNETKVKQIFGPWKGRPSKYGPPELSRQQRGILVHTYKGHGDPSKVNDKFGVAVAHVEYDAEGRAHCVFDLLHHFDPADFPDHTIDYEEVDEWIWENVLVPFLPGEFTFDQYNSTSSIQRLSKRLRRQPQPKRVQIFEKTTTLQMDWNRWETFKASINMDLVHCYSTLDDIHAERAELELRFLESPRPGKVDHPSSGPVQSKDVADCFRSDTEILTEHGWMFFKDVPKGIKVATRSPEGVLEYQEPTAYIARHHTGLMYEHESNRLNFSVTPSHRMLVVDQDGNERFVHAKNLTTQRYFIPKTSMVEERSANTIVFDSEDLSPSLVRVSGRGGNRVGSEWTEEQDAHLNEYYPTASMVDLCSVLAKSRSAIYKRAQNLDLKRGQIGDRIGDRPAPLPETKVEDFAAFLGIWLAEGRKVRDKSGYDVKITQTKPEAIEWIDQMFGRLPWPVKRSVQANGETAWIVKSHGLREYLRACQGEGHELLIPDEVYSTWTRREMEQLLEGLLVGDGAWSERLGRHVGYYSTSKNLVDDVQRLLAHLGMSGYARIVQRKTQFKANHDLWFVGVNVSQRATLETSRMRTVTYDGMVYCLTVPNTTLLVRRGGVPMWSGNCMAECVDVLIGEQVNNFLQKELSDFRPGTAMEGGIDPFPASREPGMGDYDTDQRLSAMSGFGRARGRPEMTPSRQPSRRPVRRGRS